MLREQLTLDCCWLEHFLVLSGHTNSPSNFSYGIHGARTVKE
jgi:hypothetical protein